jgi:hypothetical protein
LVLATLLVGYAGTRARADLEPVYLIGPREHDLGDKVVVAPYVRFKSPAPHMRFTAGIPVRVLADAIDPGGYQWMSGRQEAAEVRFFVDGKLHTTQPQAPGQINYFEATLPGLAAGTHELGLESLNYPDVVRKAQTITIVVEGPPAHTRTLDLAHDILLSGTTDLDWNDVTVRGHGFQVLSEPTYRGRILIKNALLTGLGAKDRPGIDITTTGDVSIESSVLEGTGAVYVTLNEAGPLLVRANEFRANNWLEFVSYDPGKSPIFWARGNSTGTKVFQANNVGAGIVRFENLRDVLVGGNGDNDSNVFIGPRCVLDLVRAPNARIRANYLHHDYHGGWSQGYNLTLDDGSPALVEHNVIRGGSWPVQTLHGEFRYNLLVDTGHTWIRGVATGSRIHHNVFINVSGTAPSGTFNAGVSLNAGQVGSHVFNNTVDAGGKIMDVGGPFLAVNAGAMLASARNNLLTGFTTRAPTAFIARNPAEASDENPRLGYSDYNAFWNPDSTVPVSYSDGLVLGIAKGSAGFGGHDVGGLNAQRDPLLASSAELPYPIDESEVWPRRLKVSQVLASYRQRYMPRSGSPLIDKGDPSDGAGTDVGAVEADSGTARPEDLFGKLGEAPRIAEPPYVLEVPTTPGGDAARVDAGESRDAGSTAGANPDDRKTGQGGCACRLGREASGRRSALGASLLSTAVFGLLFYRRARPRR